MTTTATPDGDGYVLNGQKTWISNGGIAEFYVIFATVAPGTGSKGVTAFVVEKGDEGVTFGEPMRKMGQRRSSTPRSSSRTAGSPKIGGWARRARASTA